MNGWNYRVMCRMSCRTVSKVVILISLFQPPVFAEEVDLELLEFLGEWETDDGEWVDPDQFEEEENEDKEDEKTTE